MATTDFLPFATGAGANVLTAGAFNPLPARQTGFQDGIADPAQANTVWRQTSFVTAMITQFIVDTLGQSVIDNGNLSTLEGQFIASIQQSVGSVPQAALWHFGRDTGGPDLLTIPASPVITAYADGMVVATIVNATNLTTSPTLSANGLTPAPIFNADETVLSAGDLQADALCAFLYDATDGQWRLIARITVPQAALAHRTVDTGSANAMVCPVVIPSVAAVVDGMQFGIKKSAAGNNAATTLTIAGTTAPLTWGDGTPFQGGEFPALADGLVMFDSSSGGSYRLMGSPTPAQTILQAARDYYVNTAIGSDSNDGLASTAGHALKTIQQAIRIVSGFNLNGFGVSIHVAAGGYLGPVTLVPAYGSGAISLIGAGVGTTSISSTLGSALTANAGNQYNVSGFSLSSSAPNNATADPGAGIYAFGSGTVVRFGSTNFGVCQGAHVLSGNGALIIFSASSAISISGGVTANSWAPGAVLAASAGQILCAPPVFPTLTISAPISGVYFALAVDVGIMSPRFASITGAGNFTGQKFLCTTAGGIQTNGSGINYLPGTSPGAANAPGWYA